jgi:hypothetical protein
MTEVLLIVAPVFGAIVLGLVSARTGYVADSTGKAMVEFALRIAIPALLFRMIATSPAPAASPLAIWGAFFGAIVSVWIAATLATRLLLRRSAEDAAVVSLASCFGNLIQVSLPITLARFGPEAAVPMALIFLLELAAMWLAATLQMELARSSGRESRLGAMLRGIALDLVRNPIIAATFAGAAWRMTGLGLAPLADELLRWVGQAAAPAAVFALGTQLARFELKGQVPTILAIVVLKLLALPAIAWGLAFHLFVLPPVWAGTVVLFAAAPTGLIPFVFASRYARVVDSVSAATALGVVISFFTISGVLLLLGTMPGLGPR